MSEEDTVHRPEMELDMNIFALYIGGTEEDTLEDVDEKFDEKLEKAKDMVETLKEMDKQLDEKYEISTTFAQDRGVQ